ncbi:MAG: flippase activity-associated protein Agl23 [Vicinamibacterales bacterium]
MALFGTALVVALAFRLACPDVRPMHHDEANQAVRFGLLLEQGEYRYDRSDHHGPALYYLTLPAAWVHGQADLASLDEHTLRAVPALFGAATIALFALLAGGLGRGAVAAAAILGAVSPALTYYSRFYIQEPLFVFFALGFLVALGRAGIRPPALAPAVWTGVFAGFLYSTKETSVIVFAAAAGALVVARAGSARRAHIEPAQEPAAGAGHATGRGLQAAAALVPALLISGLAYSSFSSNPEGIMESVRAFGIYAGRGLAPGPHEQSWHYYLRTLLWSNSGGLVLTEALVLVLAAVGVGSAFVRRRRCFWPWYVSLYTLFAAAAFSALRYKTPWNLLSFHTGFVVMAGVGVASLFALPRSRAIRVLLFAVLAAGCGHLAFQAWRASFRFPADPRNPYAYAQTSTDFLRLIQRINDLASSHADGDRMFVAVIAGPYEQWPLPWYLRRMLRVGYWTDASNVPIPAGTPVVIASQANAEAVETSIARGYVAEHYGLRPGVLLTMYIEPGLWESFMETRALRTSSRSPGVGAARLSNAPRFFTHGVPGDLPEIRSRQRCAHGPLPVTCGSGSQPVAPSRWLPAGGSPQCGQGALSL